VVIVVPETGRLKISMIPGEGTFNSPRPISACGSGASVVHLPKAASLSAFVGWIDSSLTSTGTCRVRRRRQAISTNVMAASVIVTPNTKARTVASDVLE